MATSLSEGKKFDGGKLRWHLLMAGCRLALAGALRVLEMGASKYGENNWQGVEAVRYVDALFRHLDAVLEHGLTARDTESGELHAHHVTTNALFISHFAELAAGGRAVRDLPAGPVSSPGHVPEGGGEVPAFPTGVVPRS